MIIKKVILSSVFISSCLVGCKGWYFGPTDPGPGSGGSPPLVCDPAASPNDSNVWVSHLVPKNNGKYKPTAKPFQKLTGIVPALVKQSNDKGVATPETELSISVAMRLNHALELDKLLKGLYDPKSPSYGKFITPSQFAEKFSPTKKEVDQVKNLLETNGFKGISVDPNRLLVHAKGSVSAVNQVFNTEVHNFKDKAGKAFYAPSYELQVPMGFSIQGVHGLDNAVTWHSHAVRLPNDPRLGRGGGFTPAEINSAYSIPKHLNGAGQSIALFELDGYNPADILAYEKAYGIAPVPLKNILLEGATGRPGNAALEVVLDIELAVAVAPGAKQILVYEGPNSSEGVLAAYNRIATDNIAKVVGVSWGASESGTPSSFIQSEASIYKQMAAQGQALYVASGDSGAYDDGVNLGVNDPASQPYVVAVGGTQLAIKKDGSYDTETSWNTDGGGGGGISDVWTLPPYQAGVANEQNQVSSKMRNVPDVSLNSDPKTGYSVFFEGEWTQVGGTSCAAPLWAAFIALVDQQRGLNGLPSLGYPNALLYQLGKGPNYAKAFHDINDESTNLYYPAVTGYDASTGWGTINGAGLLESLSGNSSPNNPSPTDPKPLPTTTPTSTPTSDPKPLPTTTPTSNPKPLPTTTPTSTPLPPCDYSGDIQNE